MRPKSIVVLILSALFSLIQCGMFEDLALFSGKDVGDIKVDVYYDDGVAPRHLYHSVDGGQNFYQLTSVYDLEYWAVNLHNELLTVEYDTVNYKRHVILWEGGVNPIEKGYFFNPDTVGPIAAGPDGNFYLCANVGAQKRLFILPPGAPTIMEIPSNININIQNIWAVKFRGAIILYVSDSNYNLYRSINGGQSFEATSLTLTSLIYDIVCFNDEIYVATNTGIDGIYRSYDGFNFNAIAVSPGSCRALHADNTRIYAATSYRLYFSYDGTMWLEGAGGDFTGIDSDYTGRLYVTPSDPILYVSDDFGMNVFILSNLLTNANNICVVSYK